MTTYTPFAPSDFGGSTPGADLPDDFDPVARRDERLALEARLDELRWRRLLRDFRALLATTLGPAAPARGKQAIYQAMRGGQEVDGSVTKGSPWPGTDDLADERRPR
jgi:hypothetical protein